MAISDPVVMPLALEMLGCLEEEVSQLEVPPAHVGLRPGSIVDFLLSTISDECCEGLAWVRVDSFYPSSGTFPAQDTEPAFPIGSWAIVLELGVVRCAPTPPETEIPSVDQWNEVVQRVMDDAAAMRRAYCCFVDIDPTHRRKSTLVGTWEPIGVEGRCVGGILPITVRGPACDCVRTVPGS